MPRRLSGMEIANADLKQLDQTSGDNNAKIQIIKEENQSENSSQKNKRKNHLEIVITPKKDF